MNSNGNDKQVIQCPACGQRFSVKMPVMEQPINTLKVSTVIATHEKPFRCENGKCRKYFIPVIVVAEITWNMLAISDEQAATLVESPIIMPPPNRPYGFLKEA